VLIDQYMINILVMNFKLINKDFLMGKVFERLEKGIYIDTDLKVYNKKLLLDMLVHYINLEEYERCIIIKKALKEIYNI
jgi:hypothetical protein